MIEEFIILILLQAIMLYLVITIGVNQETNYQELKLKHDRSLEELREMKYMLKEIK